MGVTAAVAFITVPFRNELAPDWEQDLSQHSVRLSKIDGYLVDNIYVYLLSWLILSLLIDRGHEQKQRGRAAEVISNWNDGGDGNPLSVSASRRRV